jgi:hypothetical protein
MSTAPRRSQIKRSFRVRPYVSRPLRSRLLNGQLIYTLLRCITFSGRESGVGQIRMRRLRGRSSLDSLLEPRWKQFGIGYRWAYRSSWTLYFHAVCGQFVALSAGRCAAPRCGLARMDLSDGATVFVSRPSMPTTPNCLPMIVGGTMKRPTRRSTSWDLDRESVVRSRPFAQSAIRS